jgi:ubiquinone/menaquinone biosynthesis C-methylase UbiE
MLFEKFYDAGAGAYDRVFGRVPRDFAPALLRMARLAPGMRVLDIATGTGIVAEAIAATVGPSGHVVAADISLPMLEGAKRRLGGNPNVIFAVEDGQALSFPDGHFDAVVCSLGLMLFPDPARGVAEFRRVLRPGGRAAVSAETTPERSFTTRTNAAIGRQVPERAEAAARYHSLGDAPRLRALFEAAGFTEVETSTEMRRYPFPSFDAYFGLMERGGAPTGLEYAALPEEVRQAVREDVRRGLEDDANTGGPIEVPVEILFGSGRK